MVNQAKRSLWNTVPSGHLITALEAELPIEDHARIPRKSITELRNFAADHLSKSTSEKWIKRFATMRRRTLVDQQQNERRLSATAKQSDDSPATASRRAREERSRIAMTMSTLERPHHFTPPERQSTPTGHNKMSEDILLHNFRATMNICDSKPPPWAVTNTPFNWSEEPSALRRDETPLLHFPSKPTASRRSSISAIQTPCPAPRSMGLQSHPEEPFVSVDNKGVSEPICNEASTKTSSRSTTSQQPLYLSPMSVSCKVPKPQSNKFAFWMSALLVAITSGLVLLAVPGSSLLPSLDSSDVAFCSDLRQSHGVCKPCPARAVCFNGKAECPPYHALKKSWLSEWTCESKRNELLELANLGFKRIVKYLRELEGTQGCHSNPASAGRDVILLFNDLVAPLLTSTAVGEEVTDNLKSGLLQIFLSDVLTPENLVRHDIVKTGTIHVNLASINRRRSFICNLPESLVSWLGMFSALVMGGCLLVLWMVLTRGRSKHRIGATPADVKQKQKQQFEQNDENIKVGHHKRRGHLLTSRQEHASSDATTTKCSWGGRQRM